jgi:predicted ATP-dependent serine protease
LKEASKLGFKQAVVPVNKNQKDGKAIKGITTREIDHVQKLAALYMSDDSNAQAA